MNDAHRPWAKGLRSLIVKHLTERGPMTTHELANACQVSEKAIAPRMSELEIELRARDSGFRRPSLSGKGRKLKVWEAVA
jgi:predicted ArsR family transcriptional regulator